VIGKAVADGFLLDAHFTRSFYKHMLGIPVTVQDMEGVDPEYFKNLKQILEHNLDDIGLELTFSAESHEFGVEKTIDLIPDGRNVNVTDETKHEYVALVCRHRMTSGIHKQIDSFLEGFYDLVPPELISIFNEKELELLISGLPDIDLNDLMLNTEYVSYKQTDKQIEWFWNVLRSLTREELALFLQFVTGSSKVPIEGFSELQGMRGPQKFNIHKSFIGKNMLPASHTCFNQLDLPEYESEEQTREKLLLAINEGATGFGFG
jgi:E3 ubiquitin-protein ligase HUWE1